MTSNLIGEIDMSKHFPIGGSRQNVYSFMQQNGFLMSGHSDKCWLRPADGVEVHIYGVGSMARVFNKEGKMLCDDEIAKAVKSHYSALSSSAANGTTGSKDG